MTTAKPPLAPTIAAPRGFRAGGIVERAIAKRGAEAVRGSVASERPRTLETIA